MEGTTENQCPIILSGLMSVKRAARNDNAVGMQNAYTRSIVSYTLFLSPRPSQLPHEGVLDALGPLELLVPAFVDLHVGHGLATGQLG
jgi:hypothetical protein